MKGNKTLTVALAAIMAVAIAGAQTKPKTQTQQPQEKRIVLGTNQMAGENGKFNLAYTIGVQNPINITLLDAQFSVERFNMGNNAYAPDKDEKLLVLTYWIHNPNNQITHFDGGTLKFTAVDQENENREGTGQVRRVDSLDPLNIDLKPAQKIKVQTVIVVPSKGTVPKLIVAHQSGGAVLRYDLREVLKPLPAPFAGEGFDALKEVQGQKDTYMPMMFFDEKFVSTEFIEKRFGVTTIPDDKIFFFPKFTIKKQSNTGHILRFTAQAVTEDGDRYESQMIAKASVQESANSSAEYGQELTVRFMIIVPKKTHVKKVRIWEAQGKESRIYTYDVDCQFEANTPQQAETGSTSTGSKAEVSGIAADEYATTFKTAKGETAFEATSTEVNDGKLKKSVIVTGGRTAILVEDLTTGGVTLHFPDTKETFMAPKAQGKEPATKLSYFELAYANAAAPKKKSNPLGSIGKSILGNVAGNLGSQVLSGAVLAGFGQASLPQVINNGVKSQVQGYAVQSFASQLGRAVMTSAMPTENGGPERVQEQVTVDKNVYVETTFKGRKQVGAETFAFDAAGAKVVDATTMYKTFADFMSKSAK